MITTRITLWAVPAKAWESDTIWAGNQLSIRTFVDDALAIERRMAKRVNIENERTRYTLCCARMEAALKSHPHRLTHGDQEFNQALATGDIPTCQVGVGYLYAIDLLHRHAPAESARLRMGATFFVPSAVGDHLAGFTNLAAVTGVADDPDVCLRAAFLSSALKRNCGLVELHDSYAWTDASDLTGQRINPELLVAVSARNDIEDSVDEEGLDGDEPDAYTRLREQVAAALRGAGAGRPGAVNFSNQPHNVITEVLNEFVYSESGQNEAPRYIRVVYTDGSEGKAFPLRCLPRRNPADLQHISTVVPLKVAMLSMRHLEMDHEVDVAWFRNREVSKARAFSETDLFCYLQTQKQLGEIPQTDALRLLLYQTGLQPAVIGFYRALVEELLHRANCPPSLEVTPRYYRRSGTYRNGNPWH